MRTRTTAAALLCLLLGACATWRPVGETGEGRALSLPVEEHLADGDGDTFVVLYSGDGGGGGGNRAIARALAARGTPVVAVDSLAYFWTGRTREGAARDLAALVEHYAKAWRRPKVVLAGYSFGGSALPGIAGKLPPRARARVRAMALLAPRDYVEMILRPHSWINIRPWRPHETARDIAALKPLRVVCIYGETDGLAACPRLPPGMVEPHRLAGGHTFAGRFEAVADVIAAETGP